VNIHRK